MVSLCLLARALVDLGKFTPSLLHYILPLFYKLIVSDKVSSLMESVHYVCLFFIILFKNVMELLSNTILSVWEYLIVEILSLLRNVQILKDVN